jgi:hypothetical protein
MQPVHAFLVQEGQGPATFPTAGSTMAFFISKNQDKRARMGDPGSVPPHF